MHQSHEGARKCAVVNACGAASLALLALGSGLGVLPTATELPSIEISARVGEPSTTFVATRPAVPDPPPPRA